MIGTGKLIISKKDFVLDHLELSRMERTEIIEQIRTAETDAVSIP